ncbi:uncharacterized protein LOC109823140 [Asparagus officinalis]|uniref:uncharacterized protein LOC109823140 n=1 Tax=Asparagus officinalis TaxID=4686 RepID=UPI00098DE3CF|nr:uncharacterized protein LOC109823140 [Asparagus officinalis]
MNFDAGEIDETEEVIREYINNNMILANNLRQQNYQPIHGGLIPGHAVINRDRETAHQNLVIDHRYQMSQSLFLRIVDAMKDDDYHFQQRSDGLGRMGLSLLQKVTVVFRMLAYGLPADAKDEYVKIGTNNDINVLESSNLFSNLAQGIAPPAHYVIQGKEYNMSYYLADGSTRFWKKHVLHDIMTACIIMHNMIIEDERDLYAPIQEVREAPTPEVDIVADKTIRFNQFITRYRQIKDKDAHIAFRNALIDHLWEEYTNSDS